MIIEKQVLIYGDHINTDDIIPGPYLHFTDPKELAAHAMEGIDQNFPSKAKPGVILLVGENFGCGSSREQAVTCLKHAGVKAILAQSYARIFFRNAINQGLPVLTASPDINRCKEKDILQLDVTNAMVTNLNQQWDVSIDVLPHFLLDILIVGGLLPWLQEKKEELVD